MVSRSSKGSNDPPRTPKSESTLPPSAAKSFGAALKMFRLRERLTQCGLAERLPQELNINQSYLSRVENGDFVPGRERLDAICAALRCTPKQIWKEMESLDDLEKGLSQNTIHELINCLRHEKFQLPYESVQAIEEYVFGDDSKIIELIDEIEVSAVEDSREACNKLDTLRGMAKSKIMTQKSFLRLLDVLQRVLQSPDFDEAVV